MRHRLPFTNKDEGFVMVIALVLLVLLSIMGIAITRVSYIEIQIAGNNKKMTEGFYKADGGTEVGVGLMEENLLCPKGFRAPAAHNNNDASTSYSLVGVDVFDSRFAHAIDVSGVPSDLPGTPSMKDVPSDKVRSLRISDHPSVHNDTVSHTNIAVYGSKAKPIQGSALATASGYSGNSAPLGTKKDMKIYSRHDGHAKTTNKLFLQYVFVVGTKGPCIY